MKFSSASRKYLGFNLYKNASPSVSDPAAIYRYTYGLCIGVWWKSWVWQWTSGDGPGNLTDGRWQQKI